MGSLLMVQGIPYDSPEGRAQCGAITALMHAASYAMSAEIAREQGPFPRYQANSESMLRVIRNHRRAAYNAPKSEYEGLTIPPVGIEEKHCPDYLLKPLAPSATGCSNSGSSHGYRNAQVTVVAPTGTIGLVMIATRRELSRTSRSSSSRSWRAAATSRSSTPQSRRRWRGWGTPPGRSTTSSVTVVVPGPSRAARTSMR